MWTLVRLRSSPGADFLAVGLPMEAVESGLTPAWPGSYIQLTQW